MQSDSASGIALRAVDDADLSIFFEHQLDPAANRMAAFTSRDPADREAFHAHWAKIRADASVTTRTILFEGRVAGYVARFERLGSPEVTYWLGKEYWGKGIATKALAQFLVEVKERPLFARAAQDNVASIRVLEKCGFTMSGQETSFSKARGAEVEEVLLDLR